MVREAPIGDSRPWELEICWCAQQVLLGFDSVQCSELLQKSVPEGQGRAAVKQGIFISVQPGWGLPFAEAGTPPDMPGVQEHPMCRWPGRCNHLQEAVISLTLLKKCKHFQWGHRWPPMAKGWYKQLFAHTNVQQPKRYPFVHAISC